MTPPLTPVAVLRLVHSRMRRLYPLAVAAGLAAAAAAFWLGYRGAAPEYRSTGVLRITPLTLKILYAQNDVAPSLFDGFVDVQTTIMKSRLLVEAVLASPEWQEATATQPATVEGFLAGLTITHPARSELVSLAYVDGSPLRAKLGAELLIREYLKLYGERSGNQRLTATVERIEKLQDELKRLQGELNELGHKYGTDDLKGQYQLKMNELTRLETMIKDTEINLILAEAALGTADPTATMPVAEIAAADEVMRRLLDERHRAETDLATLERKYDKKHPEVVALAGRLADLGRKIDDRAEAFRKFKRSSFVNNVGVLEGVPTPAAVDALRQRATKLRGLHDELLAKTTDLGRQSLRATYLIEEIRATKDRLSEAQGRLEQLRVDSSVVGQINLITAPEVPRGPYKDRRKMQAAGGAAGGFAAGFGLVVGLSLLDRRLYRPADVAALRVGPPLFGVLASADRPADAADRLFARWQTDPQLSAVRVSAVVAATGRADRVGAVVALGTAAAAAGQRVLLADFDPVAGLSRWAGADAPTGGLGAVLAGEADLGEAIVATPSGVDVLPAGTYRTGRRAGMTVGGLERFFALAVARYDFVLVDVGVVGDTLGAELACRASETTLLAVRRGDQAGTVRAAARALGAAAVPVAGVLFDPTA